MDILSRFRKNAKQERIKKEQKEKIVSKKREILGSKEQKGKKQKPAIAKTKPKQEKKIEIPSADGIQEKQGKQEKRAKKGTFKVAPYVLKSPQITEKASDLENLNQYVFKVFESSSKPEIKKAIEEFYGVNVSQVRVINVPRKRKRLGRTLGWRKGYRKAIVKLRQGQTIEVLPR